MDYLQGFLQLEQPERDEAIRLRRWLIIVSSFLTVISLLFSIYWLHLSQYNFVTPNFLVSLLTPFVYIIGLLLAFQWRLWQSAVLVVFWFILAATGIFWIMPIYGNLIVSLYVIILIFASVFLSKRVVTLCAAISFVLFFVLTAWRFNSDNLTRLDLEFFSRFLMQITVFVLAYLLVLLNMKLNNLRSIEASQAEARYRLLFEASPIALWEQDGSEVMAKLEQLREDGVQDFRAHFEQNPVILFEIMGSVITRDVNATAVSMYKAQNKAELMSNLDRFVPEESYSFILDSLEAMANKIPYFEQEISSLTLDNDKLTVLYRWAIPTDQEEPYTTVIASIIDVTKRKQVEDALKSYSERLHGLHELDLAINVKKSPEEISAVSLEFISKFMPSWGAEIWAYDEAGQTVSLLGISYANDNRERPFYEGPQPVAFILSEEMQDDMRDNRPYVVDDLSALRYLPPALTILEKCGMCSFVQVPLLVRGKYIGFLNVYDNEVGSFTPEYLGMVREFAAPLSIALGNVQLFVAESIARNQAEILRRVAADLNSSLDLEPLLKLILEHLEQVLPYDSATIFLEKEGELTVAAQRGVPRNISQETIGLTGEKLAVFELYKLGQPRLIADTKADPNWEAYPGFEYIRCWLAIPLQVKGKTIGVLTLDNAVARFYTERNQEIALAFANQAAIAIENARLYEQTRQYADELEVRVDERMRDLLTLYEITAVASTHLSLDKILAESLGILLRTFDCIAGAIFLNEGDGNFHLKIHKGLPEHMLPFVSIFEYQEGYIKQIVDDSKPLIIRDLSVSFSLESLNLPAGKFSYVGVSIRVKKDILGILSIVHDDGKQFSPEDVALLDSVADQLGVVIENGRLRQQTQDVAVLKERERMARELHDSITQSLYSLTLFAEASREQSRNGNNEKLREYLDDIGTTAQQALKEMRLMLYELRSDSLGEEGLVNALRYRLEAVEGRSGIEANIEANVDEDILPGLRRTLYLIAQEALNNTLKHAKAKTVFVTLVMQGKKLIMTIEDDGQGFSPQSTNKGGLGMDSMRERIEGVGGNILVRSMPGLGTKVIVSVEIEEQGVA